MLRSLLVVTVSIIDVTFAAHQVVSSADVVRTSLGVLLAAGGCCLMAVTLSRKLTGVELPANKQR